MKKTEVILIGLVILALIMKFFHLPGSGILTVLSLLSISMIYFYFGFALFNNIRLRKITKKESYEGISTKRIVGGIGSGFVLSISTIGILFKFQSWPGASMQIWVGLIGLVIVSVISLIKISKGTDNYYSYILKRIAVFGSICVILTVIPTKDWLNWKYPNNPDYVNAVLDAKANPDNRELWDKVEIEREKMHNEMNKQ